MKAKTKAKIKIADLRTKTETKTKIKNGFDFNGELNHKSKLWERKIIRITNHESFGGKNDSMHESTNPNSSIERGFVIQILSFFRIMGVVKSPPPRKIQFFELKSQSYCFLLKI